MLLHHECICHKVKGEVFRLNPGLSVETLGFKSAKWFQIDFESLYKKLARNLYSSVTLTLRGFDNPISIEASSKTDVRKQTLGPFKPGKYRLTLFCNHVIHHTNDPAEDCTAKATIYPVNPPKGQ